MYKNNCGKYNNDDCGDDDYMKLIKIDCCDELKNIEKTDINSQKLLENWKNDNSQDLEVSQKKAKIYKTIPATNCTWDTAKNRCKSKCMVLTMKKR